MNDPHRSKPMADSGAIDASGSRMVLEEPGLRSSGGTVQPRLSGLEIDDRLRAAPRGVRDNSDKAGNKSWQEGPQRELRAWKNPAITYFRAYALSSAATA